MKEVVIYDLGDPTRRRTIYADSGRIAFAANRVDLDMELYSGQMQEVSTEKPGQLDRLFYDRDRIRIRDVGRDFRQSKADSSSRSDREMGVCEMQKRLWQAESGYRAAERDYEEALKAPKSGLSSLPITAPAETKTPEPHGIGWAYCRILQAVFGVREAQAAGVGDAGLHPVILPQQGAGQDTTKKDTASKQDTGAGKNAAPKAAPKPPAPAAPATSEMVFINGKLVSPPPPGQLTPVPGAIQQTAQPVPGAPATPATDTAHAAGAHVQDSIAAAAAAEIMRQSQRPPAPGELGAAMTARTAEAKLRLDLATHSRNRYEIEIHKKFSLAAACLIFVMVAAPLAVRFPRGGVGLVIGVSLVVFAVYYVGLIGGESLANKGIVPPFWAMWGTNVIMTAIGIVLLFRMGRDQSSGRGGDFGDRIDAVRRWFGGLGRRRRPAGAA
jgi:lipopolysaccharide export system permease protein